LSIIKLDILQGAYRPSFGDSILSTRVGLLR